MRGVKEGRTVSIAKGPTVGEEDVGGGGVGERDGVGLLAVGEVGRAAVTGGGWASARGPIEHTAIVQCFASIAIRDAIATAHGVKNEWANGIEVDGSGVDTIGRKAQGEVIEAEGRAGRSKAAAAIHFAAKDGETARVERRGHRRNGKINRGVIQLGEGALPKGGLHHLTLLEDVEAHEGGVFL